MFFFQAQLQNNEKIIRLLIIVMPKFIFFPVPVHLHSPLSVQRKKETVFFFMPANTFGRNIEPFVICALPIENRGSVAPIPADLVHTSQRPFKYSMPLQDEVVAHLGPQRIPSQ